MSRQRIVSVLVATAAILALAVAPSWAGNLAGFNGSPGQSLSVVPSLPIVPPVALQQIQTASAPFGLPVPKEVAEENAAPQNSAAMDAMLAELDSGVGDWLLIAPEAGFNKLPPDGLTGIEAAHPAKHSHPVPPTSEVKIGSFLAMEVTPETRRAGVPGLDSAASASGKRALWYSLGAPQ
jgi:hypothetical protein